MKKLLLFGAASMTVAAAMAIEPSIINDAQVQAISPDGKTIVSEWGGTISLYDTASGELLGAYGDADMPYSYGLGNPFADDGTFVGSTNLGAAYLKNDMWTQLNVPSTEFDTYAWGISPDAKIIVGIVGLVPVSIDDQEIPMKVPAYWERQNDGSYSDYHLLPYPSVDFTGRVPQYVTAVYVNNDYTIYGQVVDYSGSMVALIRYTRNADNEWEYTVYNDLINPDHIVFPELPAQPEWVNPEDYMTEEEIDAYNEGVQNWNWESGDEYPVYTDYMTEQELAAYEAAMNEYNQANDTYMEAFNAFNDLLEQCQNTGKGMMFNNVVLGENQNIVYTTTAKIEEDPNSWFGYKETYLPMAIDAATGEATVKNAENMHVTAVTDDNTIVGWIDRTFYREAVVIKPGEENSISIKEYFSERRPEIVSWIEENLYHDVPAMDMETWEPITLTDCPTTGTPFTDPGFNVFATAVENTWDYDNLTGVFTYIFPASPSGVKNVADNSTALMVKALKGGRLMIKGEAENVAVYDLNGAMIYNVANPAAVVETGLNPGAYVVKVTDASGKAVTLKAIL